MKGKTGKRFVMAVMHCHDRVLQPRQFSFVAIQIVNAVIDGNTNRDGGNRDGDEIKWDLHPPHKSQNCSSREYVGQNADHGNGQ